MYCKKMIYLNWGNIPDLEIDFGPINLFSGGNGSGNFLTIIRGKMKLLKRGGGANKSEH